MRWLSVLFALLLGTSGAQAQIGLPAGQAQLYPHVTASYVGPGDLESTFEWWVGLRPYSAAKIGTKAINLCDPGGTSCVDINSDATHGLDYTAVTVTKGCNNTTKKCIIKTVYNQQGTSGRDCTDATSTFMPQLLVDTPSTGLFEAGTNTTSGFDNWSCAFTEPGTTPFSAYHVSQNVTTNTGEKTALYDNNSGCNKFCIHYNNGGDTNWVGDISGNTSTIGSISTSTLHAAVLITATGANLFVVDTTSGAISGSPFGPAFPMVIAVSANSGASGRWVETGLEATQWSSTTYCKLQKNAATFYGLSTGGYSC